MAVTHRPCFKIFLIIGCFINILAYDDIEQKCNNGEKIATLKRDSSDNESGRLGFTCEPLKPSADAIKSPKCEQGKPFTCNGEATGCPSGTWLGGVTAYQLDTSGTPDLLVPTCCSAENVNVDQCSDQQVNTVNRKIDSKLGDNEVYQNFTCWPLVKSGRQKEDSKHLFEILYKVAVCKYTAKVEATTAAPTPAPTPPKTGAAPPNNGGVVPQNNGGTGLNPAPIAPAVGTGTSTGNNGNGVFVSANGNGGVPLAQLPVRRPRPT